MQRTTTKRTYQPTGSRSGCDPVLVDEAAEQIAAPNVERQDSGRDLDWAVRRGEPEGAVGPVLVVGA